MKNFLPAAFLALLTFLPACSTPQTPTEINSPVLLIHGLCRTPRSMALLERALTKEGFTVTNLAYPTRQKSIQDLSREHLDPAIQKILAEKPTHLGFVTHSLGGIVLRQWLSENDPPVPIRVVMIAPPNAGSQLVDRIGHWPLFKWLNGPAGQQLGSNGLPTQLPPANYPLSIIAGNRSINWINSTCYLPGPDDGKVTVENTHLHGETEHHLLSASHPFILNKKKTATLAAEFLNQRTTY